MNDRDKYLIVKGICGLGNRLMTLANALEYSEKTGRKISVDWCDGMYAPLGCNAFTECFELKDFSWQKEVDTHRNSAVSFYPDVLKNLPDDFALGEYFHTDTVNKKDSKILEKVIHFGSGVAHTLLSEDYFKFYFVLWLRWELSKPYMNLKSHKLGGNKFCLGGDMPLARKEEVIIFGDFCPGYNKDYLKRHVFLREEIWEEIRRFSKFNSLDKGTIGLHVRCTDKSFDQDIDELFQIVKKFMQEHNLDKIFLATDQVSVIEKAKQKWGACLLLYDKFFPELEDGGIQGIHTWASEQTDGEIKLKLYHDAVVEMYLLAETEYLLYQGNSTYGMIGRDISRTNKCFDWQKMMP